MNPRRSNSSLPKPGRSAYGVASAVVLLLIPVVVLVGGSQFQEFLNFGAGVLSLVSLSCSVIWGLVAQDRVLLNTRQRIIGQAVHRTTAVGSIAFLLLHITTKIALDHTQLIAALIPFSLGVTGSGGLIGLGSLAGLLMVFVGVTGALRSNFATPAPVAARWRAMHMLAYPAWCAALVHGLYAGRQAKPVFVILYGLSLLGVMAGLALRSAPRPVKRRLADRLVGLFGGAEASDLDRLEASRSRRNEPGFDNRREPRRAPEAPAGPLYQSPAAPAPDPGFAAAYRTAGGPGTARQTVNTAGPASSWPVPSPPPVGEAPPSSYDPMQDTGYNIPAYGNPGTPGYGGSDVYNTGETNARYGTYNSSETFNSGPASEAVPGAGYDAPGSGEPWNTPSGGHR
ncbi:DMSO/TMAO reductase YedYZ heme-binding membrane subunit [Streptomyces sp. BK022]|uniref:cytochrome b/b6 domain-containing protein n=1 Tax=Streptomyces sp. BK022 TaxID=2512123 RepID=UPI0010D9EC25|nr:cytochrome b/b6 domain-containing protein [Streptomyces sp. BK022]RZU37502.1 DMSO/TMAO reductase YedYZ heme-binding membrane subunit [Streptomyces sp. BK022]